MAQAANRLAVEWAKSLADAAYFTTEYLRMDEPQGAEVTIIPFTLWSAQVQLMWQLMVERLVIILKARQLGISWVACAYALWLCFFQSGRVVLCFSKGQLEANELARRVRVMYERLPDWMKAKGPRLVVDNMTELQWSNGSRVMSLPASKNAGRSFTASLVIMDEMAFMQWGEELYTALKPTIDGGGQLFIISTANGESGLFHTLYQAAENGVNRFKAVFLPWWVHPKRNLAWYKAVASDAASALTVQQEYPANAEEAFVSTNVERFLDSMVWWDACQEQLPILDARTPMVLAVDAGVTSDNLALVGVTRHPNGERGKDVAVRYTRKWQPPKNGAINFDEVEAEILRLCRVYYVIELAFDPYQLHQMATRISDEGLTMVREFPQGADRLEADKGLLDLVVQRRIAHDGNSDLRQHVDNADRKVDPQERTLRIIKRSTAAKVDLCVALSMASYRCLQLPL